MKPTMVNDPGVMKPVAAPSVSVTGVVTGVTVEAVVPVVAKAADVPAPPPTWTRYIDSRLKQFCTR